ncbi:hypothetical protein [Marimonas arenosa]|uniref:Glycosyl transferase family 2 n=1 Tax=Marimonas arenosa TaxID=1795305 RepID=A0AAE3WF70_9RHOB|nr:hypothetical protein [Marimonas arenosa]MDQ2091901.1 hypothetical protein [Marimonas arenosa]
MTVIALTSVPPRFAGLGPVLESLLAQGAAKVVLALPRRYLRFPGAVSPPPLPGGVDLLRCEDHGPATKFLAAQSAEPGAAIAICDDDCLYAPGWLAALEDAAEHGAAAGSVFSVERLKRRGGLVAQGFAGVLVPAGFTCPPPPEVCLAADDLWLSAHLALAGVEISECSSARAAVAPFSAPEPLQDRKRAETYAKAAADIHDRLGIWPPTYGE